MEDKELTTKILEEAKEAGDAYIKNMLIALSVDNGVDVGGGMESFSKSISSAIKLVVKDFQERLEKQSEIVVEMIVPFTGIGEETND